MFRETEAEIAFQRHHLKRTRSSLRLVLVSGSVLFLAFAFADIGTLGYTTRTLLLLLVRLSFALAAAGCLYCLHRWPVSIMVPQIAATIITVVGMTVFMVITWYLPTEFLRHAMSMCALLMLVYFFVPNRLGTSTAIALVSSVVFVLIAMKQREIDLLNLPVLMMLLVINGFGFAVAARLQRHLQKEFHTQVLMEHQADALNNALRRAEEMTRQKVETIAYIGHDLRAPLSTISIYSKQLLDLPREDLMPAIHAIERSVRYQLGLIDELMEYTKVELQPLDVKSVPTDVSALLFDIAEYATALCAPQNNEFRFQLQAALPTLVECDGRRLQQVLLNLLSNASKFTREGTVTLAVNTSLSGQECCIGFDISDTGIGIDLAQHQDIFGAFRQTQASSGGTGLGLFIAQHIVRAMGSELCVASTPGHGTTFSFELTIPVSVQETTSWSAVPCRTVVLSGQTLPPVRKWANLDRPPQTRLLELVKLAKQGGLTDIEQWIDGFSSTENYSVFLTEVRQCLAKLDFLGIENLATVTEDALPD